MDVDRAAKLLKRSLLFSNLSAATLRSLAEHTIQRTFRKGTLIFHEGDPGETFYVLIAGSVKVFVTSERGEEMVLATLGPADTLGEVALFDGGNRSASVEALEPVTTLALARSTLREHLLGDPAATDALLRAASVVLRRLTGQAADLVFLDLEGRVAKLLVALADRIGTASPSGVVLQLGVTQSDLARMVGGSRQSVNQILHGLQARGFIEVRGRTVIISRRDALRRRAGIA